MKPPPPRRNYKQMVRVVRDSGSSQQQNSPHNNQSHVPYQLANAYGDKPASPVHTRERSLDEIGIDSRTSRLPEPAAAAGYLPKRETTTLFHQLSRDQQQYFTGVNPNPVPTRQDGWPGTKSRTYLGGEMDSQQVITQPPHSRAEHAAPDKAMSPQNSGHVKPGAPTPFKPLESGTSAPPKQTRLPLTTESSLAGTQGKGVDFEI